MQHNDFSPTTTLKSKVWHIGAKPEARLSVGDTFSFEFKQTIWKWMYVAAQTVVQSGGHRSRQFEAGEVSRDQHNENKHYLDCNSKYSLRSLVNIALYSGGTQ